MWQWQAFDNESSMIRVTTKALEAYGPGKNSLKLLPDNLEGQSQRVKIGFS